MNHEQATNPCFFDHTCPDNKPCPNIRPLPGNPPVLSIAEQKLKEIDEIILDFEGKTFESSEDASDYLCYQFRDIRKILDR